MLDQDNTSRLTQLIGKGIGAYGRAGYDRGGHSAEKSAQGPEGTPFSALMLEPQMEKRTYMSGAIRPRLLEEIDANGDGKLDETEFRDSMRDSGFGKRLTAGADDPDKVMAGLFTKLDQNGDGNLSSEEIRTGRDSMRSQIVSKLDADQDGSVSREERLGFRQGFEAQADTDGDGQLSRAERMAMRGEMLRSLLNIQEEANAKTDEDVMLDILTGKTETPALAQAA